MLDIICSILLTVTANCTVVETRADVEGKILYSNDRKYVVDFSEGVKKYKLAGKPSDYNKVLVDKDQCVLMPTKE